MAMKYIHKTTGEEIDVEIDGLKRFEVKHKNGNIGHLSELTFKDFISDYKPDYKSINELMDTPIQFVNKSLTWFENDICVPGRTGWYFVEIEKKEVILAFYQGYWHTYMRSGGTILECTVKKWTPVVYPEAPGKTE